MICSRPKRRTRHSGAWGLCLAIVSSLSVLGIINGCANRDGEASLRQDTTVRDPLAPAYSLGNLRIGRMPSKAEVQLAQFLFGVEPEAGLLLIKPMDLAAGAGRLLIAEGAFQRVLRWTPQSETLDEEALNDPPMPPGALALAPDGDVLIAAEGGGVQRFRAGSKVAEYRMPAAHGKPCRIGGIACVGGELWVTNLSQHRVEVFDAASAQHLRSIGQRGAGPAEFGLPLGITVHDGEVFIADMLNARVQVLDERGVWLRNIGGPGNRLGYFGRPRGLAIGPDGTLFVADAALQRITAFTIHGAPLTTFGGPNDADPLVLPAGVAIWSEEINAGRTLPPNFAPAYFVLVSEQISRPGIRAFAWKPPVSSDFRTATRPPMHVTAAVANPHYDATRCTGCHAGTNDRPEPIPANQMDAICLSCHDGVRAVAEAHPIGRVAETAQTRLPPGRPVLDGRVTCLTCHDILVQCENPVRPRVNPALVRGYDPLEPMNTCKQCHIAESWRVNPHQGMIAGANSLVSGCGFCHTTEPIAAHARDATLDVTRGSAANRISAKLRDETTRLCLNCHTMHADPAPDGHLHRPVPASILSVMRIDPAADGPDGVRPEQTAHESRELSLATLLPLEQGAITCATCHNPHPAGAEYAGYFQRAAARLRSTLPEDDHKALRLPHVELCLHCHPR